MSRLLSIPQVVVPVVTGCTLSQALSQLAVHQLFGQVVAECEDDDIAQGTVIEQVPNAGTSSKPRQVVGLTIVKKPPVPIAPAWRGKSRADIREDAKKQGIRLKEHALPGPQSTLCYAQYPLPGAEMGDKTVDIYLISQDVDARLMPNFKGMLFVEAQRVLQEALVGSHTALKVVPVGANAGPTSYIVAQSPASGEVIDKNRLARVYFQIVSPPQ